MTTRKLGTMVVVLVASTWLAWWLGFVPTSRDRAGPRQRVLVTTSESRRPSVLPVPLRSEEAEARYRRDARTLCSAARPDLAQQDDDTIVACYMEILRREVNKRGLRNAVTHLRAVRDGRERL
jgi:hypothetical protein